MRTLVFISIFCKIIICVQLLFSCNTLRKNHNYFDNQNNRYVFYRNTTFKVYNPYYYKDSSFTEGYYFKNKDTLLLFNKYFYDINLRNFNVVESKSNINDSILFILKNSYDNTNHFGTSVGNISICLNKNEFPLKVYNFRLPFLRNSIYKKIIVPKNCEKNSVATVNLSISNINYGQKVFSIKDTIILDFQFPSKPSYFTYRKLFIKNNTLYQIPFDL